MTLIEDMQNMYDKLYKAGICQDLRVALLKAQDELEHDRDLRIEQALRADRAERCSGCLDPEHDTCPGTPGCPCCADTARQLLDASYGRGMRIEQAVRCTYPGCLDPADAHISHGDHS